MRKEILFAIFIGILFGLVVTYGVYTANRAIVRKQQGGINTASTIPTPTATPLPDIDLTIADPEDGTVVTEAETTVKGTTTPNALVTILTEGTELITEADKDGVFSQKVTLVKGANTIEVTATDLNQMSPTKILYLVYSTELETETDTKE